MSGAADYILPIGLLLGGGYLLYQFFKPGGFLSTGAGNNNSSVSTANSSAATQTAQQLAAQGIKPTITADSAANVANQVYTAGLNATDASACITINNLLTGAINNAADLNLIVSAFGTKSIPAGNVTAWYNTCLSLGLNCTSVGLGDFVHSIYGAYDSSGQYLSALDDFLTAQGISYQF